MAPSGTPTPTPIAVSRYGWDLSVAGGAALDALQDDEIVVREVVSLGVDVLVGDDDVDELSLDDDDEGLLLAIAARAPRPATGVASDSVKGEPTSHTG